MTLGSSSSLRPVLLVRRPGAAVSPSCMPAGIRTRNRARQVVAYQENASDASEQPKLQQRMVAELKDLKLLQSSLEAKLDQAVSNIKHEINTSAAATQKEIAETRAEFRQEIAETRAEFRQEIAETRAEFRQLFVGLICLLLGLGIMAAKDLQRFL